MTRSKVNDSPVVLGHPGPQQPAPTEGMSEAVYAEYLRKLVRQCGGDHTFGNDFKDEIDE